MRGHTVQQGGFTLLEIVVVIVITGIVGAMLAVFINAPVKGYVDSSRRADMTDVADTALRRLARDIHTAVPNSLRLAGCGGVQCVEYLPTRDGGRYRVNVPGNPLSFGVVDGDFDIVGPSVVFAVGDQIVVGSTQSDGNPPYDATIAGIRRLYTGASGAQATVTMANTALPLWAAVAPQRFHVVDGTQQAVTYACENVGVDAAGNGTGMLNRYAAYGYRVAQASPAALAGLGIVPAVLANNVSACTITYNAMNQRNALLEIELAISRGSVPVGSERISLYHAIHINNFP